MKKLILPLLIAFAAMLFSSCIVIAPGIYDENGNYVTTGTVTIVKSDDDYESGITTYIKTVDYYDYDSDAWVNVYKYSRNNRTCRAEIPTGNQTIRCEVYYPDYENDEDFHGMVYTQSAIKISSYKKSELTYDWFKYDKTFKYDGKKYQGYLYETNTYDDDVYYSVTEN